MANPWRKSAPRNRHRGLCTWPQEDPAWLAEVRGQWTLLHVAAGNGYLDVIKFLLKTAPPPGCSLEVGRHGPFVSVDRVERERGTVTVLTR